MTLRVDLRAAAVELLTDYVASIMEPPKMQIYRARPRTVAAPSAFIDVIRVTRVYQGIQLVQETAQADIIVLHGPRLPGGGSFDSGDATDQADRFADGFAAWVDANVHAIGPNTTVGFITGEDDPTYVPDWVPVNEQLSYYATRITLEGYAASLTI
jgi:hypothetical protein